MLLGFEITDHSIYLLPPGRLRYLETEQEIQGYIIAFHPEFLLPLNQLDDFSCLLERFGEKGSLIILEGRQGMIEEIEDILVRMKKEYDNYFTLRSEVLRGLMRIFIIYLSRRFDIGNMGDISQRDKGLMKRFIALVRQNYLTMKMVSEYAALLNVTPSYLNYVVKKTSGSPASHHIRQNIVHHAKNQALYSDLSMKEIAYSLGFNDYAHFSKFFKKACGMNFTHFKRMTYYTG